MTSHQVIDAATVRPGTDRHEDRTLVRIGAFTRWPNAAPLTFGVFLVTLIAVCDNLTGRTFSVGFLYVGAAVVVTWLGTMRSAMLVAALAVTESLLADLMGSWDLTRTMVLNAATSFGVMLFIVWIISSLRRSLIQQRHLAMVDPLTGALNRRSFSIAADRERLRAARTGLPVSMAYLDLDDFKGVNDRHGHKAGDHLLRIFAETVSSSIRGTDIFARIGGDEFIVMFPETGARDAISVVQRITRTIGDHCCTEDERISASVGIMTFQYPPATVDAMISEADRMMYQAKSVGPGQIVGAVAAGPWLRWATESMRPDLSLLQDDPNDVMVELFR